MTNKEYKQIVRMKWHKRAGLLLAAMVFATLLTGCWKTVERTDGTDNSSMFVRVERTEMWEVVYNKQTKVMYAVSCGSDNYGTFTLLVNADGTPMVYGG